MEADEAYHATSVRSRLVNEVSQTVEADKATLPDLFLAPESEHEDEYNLGIRSVIFFRKDPIRTALTLVAEVSTGGLLALALYWLPITRLRLTHRRVGSDPAVGLAAAACRGAALVTGLDGSLTLAPCVAARPAGHPSNHAHKNSHNGPDGGLDSDADDSHKRGHGLQGAPYVDYRHLRYYYYSRNRGQGEDPSCLRPALLSAHPHGRYHRWVARGGLTGAEVAERRSAFGPNCADVPVPGWAALLAEEVPGPFWSLVPPRGLGHLQLILVLTPYMHARTCTHAHTRARRCSAPSASSSSGVS